MTEKKKPAAKVRRRVSKPRLLREILSQMEVANLVSDATIQALIQSIEQGIIQEAVDNS
jgi:hypothetical protein